MLTQTDIINARVSAVGRMNESDIIRYILEEDGNSEQKKNMAAGARYYVSEHDTLAKQYDSAVVEETDETDGTEKTVRRNFQNPN